MSIGHPDWQTYASWRGAPLVDLQGTTIPVAGQNYGPFNIPHYSSVSMFASVTSQPIVIQLTFYMDAAYTQAIQVMQWTLTAGTKVTVTVPALSPYVGVAVTNWGAGSTLATIYIEPTNVGGPAPVYVAQSTSGGLAYGAASVAASGSMTILTTEIYSGQVLLTGAQATNTSWRAQLLYWDAPSAAWRFITEIRGSIVGQRGQQIVACPPSALEVVLFNDDTSARSCDVSLVRAGP